VQLLTILVALAGSSFTIALARSARRVGATHRARQMGGTRAVRLPRPIRRRLVRMLAGAGIDVTPEAAAGWWVLGGGCIVVLATALSPVTGLLGLGAAIAAGPVVVTTRRARMRDELDHAVPDLLERTAIELRSGGTVIAAVTNAQTTNALALSSIIRRVELGAGFSDALAAWADRLGRPDVRAAAGAFGLAAAVGGRAADALDGLAASLRARLAALAEARAQAAQARLSAIVVGAAPVVFLAFSAVTDPTAVRTLVATSFGRVCLAIGLAMELLAVAWIRRIVRSEP